LVTQCEGLATNGVCLVERCELLVEPTSLFVTTFDGWYDSELLE